MMRTGDSNFQQALWLGIGQFCTFAITFLTAPILARYFDKVEYGTYRQILYVYTSVQTLFTMGLPSVFSYFIPRLNTGQQKLLVRKMTLLLFLLGAAFSLLLYVSADMISGLLKNPELSTGLRLFSPFPLFTLPTMGVEGIYTALRRTKEIAVYHIVSKLFMLACIVLPVVIWHMGYREAVIGWGIASFLTFLVAMYMKNKPYFKIQVEEIPNIYRDVFGYSLPLAGAFVVGFFVNSADQFFVSRYYGTQVFAEFSNGCFSIPIVGMVAASVKGVLLPLFSKADAEHDLTNVVQSYNNAVKKTATIVLPMLLFCFFFANDIMIALFGEKYQASKDFLRMYMLRDFFEIFPYLAALLALGYTRWYMKMHVVGAFLIWGIDFLLVYFFHYAPFIVLISSLFQISCRLCTFIYIYKKKGLNLLSNNVLLYVAKLVLHSLLILSCMLLCRYFCLNSLNEFESILLLGPSFYVVLIISGKKFNIDYVESVKILVRHGRC